MIELAFLGRSGDSQSIVFTDEKGSRYCVAITESLRQAVKRGTNIAAVEPVERAPLRPADIQTLLRSGLTAAEIAERENTGIEKITRYEAPVRAEIAWAISQAQLCRIGDVSGAPVLEDLVVNRLAARGVDPSMLAWSALRHPGQEWEVTLTFVQGGVERHATWELKPNASGVKALDEEAAWLTEDAAPLAPVSAFFPPTVSVASDEAAMMEDLIDEANAQRGRPVPILESIDVDDDAEDNDSDEVPGYFSSRLLDDAAPSHPTLVVHSTPVEISVSEEEPDGLFAVENSETPPEPSHKKTNTRRSVPSWDEIVFGSKND